MNEYVAYARNTESGCKSIVFAIQIIPQGFFKYCTLLQYQRKLSDDLQRCENHKILNVKYQNIS